MNVGKILGRSKEDTAAVESKMLLLKMELNNRAQCKNAVRFPFIGNLALAYCHIPYFSVRTPLHVVVYKTKFRKGY